MKNRFNATTDRQPEPIAGGSELTFGSPVDEAVLHLRGDRSSAIHSARVTCQAGMVGQADVADLALPDEVVIGRQGLLQRGVRVGIVGVATATAATQG